MGKFITLREEFESETNEHPFTDQKYIEWLERIVERNKHLHSCKYVKRVGESCTLNDNCNTQIAISIYFAKSI